jgi:hypothetical protein
VIARDKSIARQLPNHIQNGLMSLSSSKTPDIPCLADYPRFAESILLLEGRLFRTSLMKIDLNRFEGRELNADDDSEEPKSVWEAYGYGEEARDYRWVSIPAVALAIGGVCAAISLDAFVKLLALCGLAVLLIGGAVIWIDSETHPFI